MNGLVLVVFDVAGTVVKDRDKVPEAFTAALEAHGISLISEELAAVRGSSKREAILRFVSEGPERESLAKTVYSGFRERLMERHRMPRHHRTNRSSLEVQVRSVAAGSPIPPGAPPSDRPGSHAARARRKQRAPSPGAA